MLPVIGAFLAGEIEGDDANTGYGSSWEPSMRSSDVESKLTDPW